LAFSWTELVYPNAAAPAHIAALAIAYSALTWAGMLAYGRDTWLQHGEVFSLVFGTFARFAPTEATEGRLLLLRPFGRGLLDGGTVSTSMMAFVLLLLASVLYDGLIGTGEWALLEGALRTRLPGLGESGAMLIRSVGLIAFWLLFLGAFIGISTVMSRVASGRPRPLEVARSFALTLVPIAIGYDVAHYLVFLLVQGQYIVPLLSDPFGRGWNLFRPAGYSVDIARRRALCLVCGRRRHRHGPRCGRLSRARAGDGRVRAGPPGAGHAGAADGVDGGLHVHRPLHHRRADRREPRRRRADCGGERNCPHPCRRRSARGGQRAIATGGVRAERQGEAHLQGAGLRLS
jgi:hypothetical protein